MATRYALPQIKATRYHQIALDWLLRDGSSYDEDRELGERRARAALLLELALPGSAYVYQGEELGLFEVADVFVRFARASQNFSKKSSCIGCRHHVRLFPVSGHGSVGRAQPCQGWGRGFEPRCPLHLGV